MATTVVGMFDSFEAAHAALDELAANGIPEEDLGVVHFPTSCDAAVAKDFDRAVALLHSFGYDLSRDGFRAVAARDPRCGMAWWDVAMTYYHPLWAPPTEVELREGFAASRRALDLGGKTPRERGFIEAITTFFAASDTSSAKIYSETCHGPRDHAGFPGR